MKDFFQKTFLIVLGIIVGFLLYPHLIRKVEKFSSSEEILEEATYNTILHRLLYKPECVPMNATELAQAHNAVETLKTFPEISKMHISAIRYFGDDQYRREGNDKIFILCIPSEVKSEVLSQINKEGLFTKKFIEPYLLHLAFKLGPDSSEIVTAVGNTAFYPEGVYYSSGDARPLARLVLSSFGSKASPWADQALSEISNKDSLGTSAAMVAAAAENPKAIERTSQLIDDILDRNKSVVKFKDTEKLYQLVVAMAMAGNEAQPYVDSLIDLSGRKIESWAPPFGIIELQPKYLCSVMKLIGGPKAEEVLNDKMCSEGGE